MQIGKWKHDRGEQKTGTKSLGEFLFVFWRQVQIRTQLTAITATSRYMNLILLRAISSDTQIKVRATFLKISIHQSMHCYRYEGVPFPWNELQLCFSLRGTTDYVYLVTLFLLFWVNHFCAWNLYWVLWKVFSSRRNSRENMSKLQI